MPPTLGRLRAARLHQHHTFAEVDEFARATIGLHSTDYASPYLSARARVPSFDAAALFARLQRGDGLVRVNCFRNTVHVVTVADWPMITAATGSAVAAVGRKMTKATDAEVDANVAAIVAALDGGPLGTNELKAAVPHLPDTRSLVMVAMGRGLVVRADAVHARSNRARYALAAKWMPAARPWPGTVAEARRALIHRAVEAFGPLTVDDLAWWVPAPKGEVTKALAGSPFAKLEVDGAAYWYAPALADAPAPPREDSGAWLLPYEDGLLKGTLDRSGWLAPGLRPVVFPRHVAHYQPPNGGDPGPGPHGGVNVSGEARPTVWWGGRVVGRWEERDPGLDHQVHVDIGAEGLRRVNEAVDELRRWLADDLGPISG